MGGLGSGLVFESLMDGSLDEPLTEYGLLAQTIDIAADALEANPADLEIVDGIVRVIGTPVRSIPLTQVAVLANPLRYSFSEAARAATQFAGEAHFERARFYGIADFRTIAGEELSFNQVRFHNHWMLDDANVPGRLTTTEADLLGKATLSLAGAWRHVRQVLRR